MQSFVNSATGYEYPTYRIKAVTNGENLIQESGPMHPSVVKIPEWVPVEKRLDHEARYYLYWAQHSGKKIYIRWTKTLTDMNPKTWKPSKQCALDLTKDSKRKSWNHVGAVEVGIDHERKLFYMYFHGESSKNTFGGQSHSSFLATSCWGTNFNDPDTGNGDKGTRFDGEPYGIVETKGHPSEVDVTAQFGPQYARAFTVRGHRYAIGKRGQIFRAPPDDPGTPQYEPWTAHSDSDIGQQWEAWPQPETVPERPLPANRYNRASNFSPLTRFMGSTKFAKHKNNPHPGHTVNSKGSCTDGRAGSGWVNHLDIQKIADHRYEVFFYVNVAVKIDNKRAYTGIYRVVLNTKNPNWAKWDLLRDESAEVIFEVALAQDQGFSKGKPLGDPCVFMDQGRKYLFYSYGPEGSIGAVELVPNQR